MSEIVAPAFDIAIEDERDVPIENSHLFRGRCECGAVALHAAGRRARCGECLRRDAGAGVVSGVTGREVGFWPVISFAPAVTVPQVAAEREAYPAPEWTSRDPVPPGVTPPAVAAGLAGMAGEAGWSVRVQCSRGQRPHGATGRPLAPKTLWAVILGYGEGFWSAYAVHDGAAWSSVMLWGRTLPFFPLASITDLQEFVRLRGEVGMPAWLDAIRERVHGSAARTKARAACNRGVHPLAETQGGVTWCPTCLNSWKTSGEPWRKPKIGKSEAL